MRLILAVVVLGLAGVWAVPASAAPRAAACVPSLAVLPTVRPDADGSVRDISDLPGLVVGRSASLPVYWTGRTLRRVPLPATYVSGQLDDVNHFGLMLGWAATDASGYARRYFRYWQGSSTVQWYPEGLRVRDLNDAGHAVASGPDGAVELSETHVVRVLPPPPAALGLRLAEVVAINNAGQVLGTYLDDEVGTNAYDTVVWPSTTATPVVLTPTAEPLGINEHGSFTLARSAVAMDGNTHVLGREAYSDPTTFRTEHRKGIYWSSPRVEGALAPGYGDDTVNVDLVAVSDRTRQVVGTTSDVFAAQEDDPGPPTAVTWHPGDTSLTSLPRLVVGRFTTAYGVNDDGRVGGAALDASGIVRPVVWQTCA